MAYEAEPWAEVHVELTFEPWNAPFVAWVNLSPWLLKLYEATPLRVFPARDMVAELIK